MAQHTDLSNQHQQGANISHQHTCATAIECFDGAVANNRKKRMAEYEANRNALAWVRNVVVKQIPDAGELAAFERFLAEKEKQFPSRQPEQQGRGPTVYSFADAQRLLNGQASVTAMVHHLLEREHKWNPSDRAAIDLEIVTALASENRKRYAREGTLDAAALERAQEEAKNYLANARRRAYGGRPQHGGNRGGQQRSDHRPRFEGGGTFVSPNPRPQGPKVVSKPATEDEAKAESLRYQIEALEAEFVADKGKPEEERWNAETRAKKIAEVKALKDELSWVKAGISATQTALATAKKKERIARRAASASANRAVPAYRPETRKEPAASEANGKKNKKGGKR